MNATVNTSFCTYETCGTHCNTRETKSESWGHLIWNILGHGILGLLRVKSQPYMT